MKLLWILILGLSGSIMGEGDPGMSQSQFVEKFREESLNRHNLFRQGYFGTQPLVLSTQLCESSQDRADKWAQNSRLSDTFSSKYEGDIGENTYAITLSKGVDIYGSTPVDEWYDQIHDYDFTTGETAPNTKSEIVNPDSFTQVVWKGTKEMCISYAIGPNNELGTRNLYIVAHYNPEGSIKGAQAQNVKPIFVSPNFYVHSNYAPKPKHLTPPITLLWPEIEDMPEKDSKMNACGKFPKETNVSTPIDWIEEAIHVANGYREMHGAPDLIHDPALDQVAQKLVNTFVELSLISTPPKSKLHGCGETIFTKLGNIEPAAPIDAWYKQVHVYDFQHHRSRDKKRSVDSFTQLVWKGSKQMGTAYAKKDGKTFVVAIYAPGGNKANEYKLNVLNEGSGNKGGMLLMIVTFVGLTYQLLKK